MSAWDVGDRGLVGMRILVKFMHVSYYLLLQVEAGRNSQKNQD